MDTFVQQIINGLVLGSMYALVALGYTMVYGIINLINFAHGEVAAAFASLRGTLRSAPAPDQLLARLAADGQVQTAAAMLNAWRQGAVQC